jgi:tripartite-type tricarboxylate transporter receptor subunit TctC
LPRSPIETSFLSYEDKEYVDRTLEDDGVLAVDAKEDGFSWPQVIKTVRKPHVLIVAITGFFNGMHILTMFSDIM